MNLSRREFLQMLAVAAASGLPAQRAAAASSASLGSDFYDLPRYGNVHLLHYTDCHAQLNPVHFREPSINIGVHGMRGRAPHLVGDAFLEQFGLPPGGPLAHAFTYLNFTEAAQKYGRIGGYAHLATLVKQLRASRPGALLLDGGDTWQGSATSLWTNAQDVIDAQKILGVDIMTGHWEFTFGAERVMEVLENDFADAGIDFVAQNVVDRDFEEAVFKPYVIREQNGVNVAVIGQAFPYTPIANPGYLIPEWSFGIRDERMQETVDAAREEGAEVVVVLSHNGMDVDLKMASRVSGIDAILGGHTHDAVPQAMPVKNDGGTTLVMNAGSNNKFLGVLDFDVQGGKVRGHRFQLLPVFANLLPADAEMQAHIDSVHDMQVSYRGETFNTGERLGQVLATSDVTLYRRGNFSGTWDQVLCDALMQERDAQISFSAGVRWGTSLLPGDITYGDMMTQVALTYPASTRSELSGEMIKTILEDVCDNLFHEDPYYQQGGDMVRVGGMKFSVDPTREIGQRISDMSLDGKAIDASKNYVVAGWANVNDPAVQDDPANPAVWDVLASYLRDKKHIDKVDLNSPQVKGLDNNPGYAG